MLTACVCDGGDGTSDLSVIWTVVVVMVLVVMLNKTAHWALESLLWRVWWMVTTPRLNTLTDM